MSDEDEHPFNPSRLTLARKRRGINKTKLAAKIGVDLRSISGYEDGEYAPDDEPLSLIAKHLGFPREFFFGPDLSALRPDWASFRSLTRMTASQRDMALGSGALALHLNAWIERRFNLPAPAVPDFGPACEPEVAAAELRRQWGLGELPIANTVHLLESRGIRVFSLSIDAAEVDAFSMWRGDTPYVFLNTMKSAEHSRFDAAHELGHLVMHRHGTPQGQDAEKEANAFASAFLMPRASVLAVSPYFTTVDRLIELKKNWNVSVAALAYRMHDLCCMSEWQYRNVMIDISRRGFRKSEPDPSPRETSKLFMKVMAALREDGVAKADIAEELKLPVQEIEELIFGLSITGIASNGKVTITTRPRGNLRRVK
jgi:Zn-dependent peptidase ImmA (M78 family)/transcriptional regulator with XRE-family HTH domain